MDLNSEGLNRSDSIRKSLRLHSARKGLAPAPPTFDNIVSQNDNQNNDEEVQLRRPTSTVLPSMPMERSTLLPKMTTTIPSTRSERSALSLMVIESKNTENKQQKFQSELLGEEDDANVSFALGSIEKHINQVEESFKHLNNNNNETKTSINELQVELVRKGKRYMETENLLQPCSSEMSSENDFQYLGGNDDLQADEDLKGGQEFQRNSDARSSMGATYTAGKMTAGTGVLQRSKIARTVSDTKNTDVLAMRAIIKQKQQQQQQVLPIVKQLPQPQMITTTTTTATDTGETLATNNTEMVDGNIPNIIAPSSSSSLSSTTSTFQSGARRVSQRTREENLRHFEALLAAHKASKTSTATTATATNTTTTTTNTGNSVSQVRRTTRPLMPTNKITNVPPVSTSTAIKPQIIAPPTQHWAPPLVVGRNINTNVNINNNRLTTINNNNNNNNNMSQVNKRQSSK